MPSRKETFRDIMVLLVMILGLLAFFIWSDSTTVTFQELPDEDMPIYKQALDRSVDSGR